MRTAQYITKGQNLSIEQIKNIVLSQLDDMKNSEYRKKEMKYSKDATEYDIAELVETLHGVNDALLNGRDVFVVTEKEPKGNLDTGKHYFSIHYITPNGKTRQVWSSKFYWYIGMEQQSRDMSIPKYIFNSGAIGMSRLLDATDGLFTRLKSITGTYCQIS